MARRRCRHCYGILRGEPEQIGARCPHCRRALYERADEDDGTPIAEPVERDACALHAGNTAVAACPRCGNFYCDTCRTRWRDRWLCVACVDRALAGGEAAPHEQRAHRRQAILSVVFGALTWVFAALGILAFLRGTREDQPERMLPALALAVFVLIFGLVGSGVGLAQGVAAVRARGDHLILATAGLLLSGLYAGMLIGLFCLSAWQN